MKPFTCGTRKVVVVQDNKMPFQVQCATCNNIKRKFDSEDEARQHTVKTSSLPCSKCGAQ